ncbi:hypothetical protein [Scytonema sp. HK-05]|uniref:hypothetical protein n=1 Tax=Scytonema sp. HK-05 TaxID=1137095 RepID=UPI000AF91162|nr:hypothetical protein [Scytonema sp. HK-05]
MNRIEDEWHQLKTHEIAGRMFEHEYDLAIALCPVPFGQSLLWMAWKPEVLTDNEPRYYSLSLLSARGCRKGGNLGWGCRW